MPYDAFGIIGMDTITDFKNLRRVRLTVGCVYLESYFKDTDRGMAAKGVKF